MRNKFGAALGTSKRVLFPICFTSLASPWLDLAAGCSFLPFLQVSLRCVRIFGYFEGFAAKFDVETKMGFMVNPKE